LKEWKVIFDPALTNINREISIIDLHKNPHSNMINESGGYKKICDYLIMVPQQTKVLVLFCELKKTFSMKGGDQLKATIPFPDYLQSLIRVHYEQKVHFKHHFVILAHKNSLRLDKQDTRPSPVHEANYKNIRIKVILGENIPFEKMMP